MKLTLRILPVMLLLCLFSTASMAQQQATKTKWLQSFVTTEIDEEAVTSIIPLVMTAEYDPSTPKLAYFTDDNKLVIKCAGTRHLLAPFGKSGTFGYNRFRDAEYEVNFTYLTNNGAKQGAGESYTETMSMTVIHGGKRETFKVKGFFFTGT